MKIGICWQGNPSCKGDRRRSIPLRYFDALARVEGVSLISLQKKHGLDQLRRRGHGNPDILDFGDELDETAGAFTDTAAIMKSLDPVITSDTAVPHLAGALRVKVWLLLPFAPDWRRGLTGSHSAW